MKTIIKNQDKFNELAESIKDFANYIYTGEELICISMKLVALPELPHCKTLFCFNNQLKVLPELPRCKRLECGNNQLTSLPELPMCERLVCSHNQLTELPEMPKLIAIESDWNVIKKNNISKKI